jgi:hypothetical protein
LAALLRNRLSEFAGVVVRDLGRHRCGRRTKAPRH